MFFGRKELTLLDCRKVEPLSTGEPHLENFAAYRQASKIRVSQYCTKFHIFPKVGKGFNLFITIFDYSCVDLKKLPETLNI